MFDSLLCTTHPDYQVLTFFYKYFSGIGHFLSHVSVVKVISYFVSNCLEGNVPTL